MQQFTNIKKHICSVTTDGDILFLVPPFGSLYDIPLGPHILQALVKERGYTADILYLNILLASLIGVEHYEEIYYSPEFRVLGERLFARSAYDLPPLGHHPEWCADEALSIRGSAPHTPLFYDVPRHIDLERYLQTEEICKAFLDEVIAVIASLNYRMAGCTSIMWQTNCSIALLNGIKQQNPDMITIIGGSNCDGDMAEGIASLSDDIDYVFSGESETAFLRFLQAEELPTQRIIKGEALNDPDDLPLPDYSPCFEQYARCFGETSLKKIKIWYETSRGCWWAERSQCTFCGITHVAHRQKSVNKVVHDLKRLRVLHPEHMIFMADSLMPRSYHKELLPVLSHNKEFPAVAYSLRATLDLKDLAALKKANITALFPGIESFSTNLLKLMRKGIGGRQSLLFLRNAASVGIYCDWFLLWGFPGDAISEYEDLLSLLPLIRHLQPPRKFEPMQLARFSPYLADQHAYNLTNLRPWAVFETIYPEWASKEKLARQYIAEYACEAYERPDIIRKLADEVAEWQKTWKNTKLMMGQMMDTYLIYDTRGEHKKTHVIEYEQAREIMTSRAYDESEHLQWAVAEKLGVVLDSWYVPLVTAAPEVLSEFEERG